MRILYSALFCVFVLFSPVCWGKDSEAREVINYDELTQNAIAEYLRFAEVPRPTFSMDKARAFLTNFAKEHHFPYERDNYGNLWMDIPATSGWESCPKMILQSHMDMVCAAEAGLQIDFNKEVGNPVVDGNTIYGKRMNLGADDGIGVGIMLALAVSNVPHGPLRCLFTADEEVGLMGAKDLSPNALDANYLINLEIGKVGNVVIACTGAYTCTFSKSFSTELSKKKGKKSKLAFMASREDTAERILQTID